MIGVPVSSLHPHILGWPRCTVGFPGCSVVKNPPAKAGDSSSIVGSGRSPGGENGNPLQYPRLENPMDRELGRLQSVGSQKGRHDLVTKHQRKGIFYLEWCRIKDMVFIHSFFHQRVIELLYAPRIKTTKMSETQLCPEAVHPPERCSQKQTHHFFALMMTPREAGSRGIGNPGKGKKSVGSRQSVRVPFPCHSVPFTRVTPGF